MKSWLQFIFLLLTAFSAPAITRPTELVLNDYSGNVLATIFGKAVKWNPVRVSGYGPVLGYQASTLTPGTALADTLVWRSRGIDPSGFYCLGARYYDPVAGRFLSPDPLGHAGSMDLYSFCGGDPLNRFDPTGRFGKGAAAAIGDLMDFSGEGPSYSAYLTRSSASTWGYGYGWLVGQVAVQGTMFMLTAGLSVEAEGLGMAGFMERSEIQAGMLAEREAAVVAQSEFAGTAAGGLVEAEEIAASGAARAGVAEGTMNVPEGLMEEAGRLEGQWPAQMQSLRESEVPLNMAAEAEASEAGAGVAADSGGFTTLYHGTSSEAAAAIRANGIDLSFSRANLDFGKGFYTTTDLGQAQAWAARQGGEVLTFNVPNSQLSQLSHLQFPGANGAWADFVGANRGGASLHGFDIVSGPMLGNPRAFMNGASPTAFGQQMSFHSDAAVNLLNNSLLP